MYVVPPAAGATAAPTQIPEQGARVRAHQLSFASPKPRLPMSPQGLKLLVSASYCPSETPCRVWNLLDHGCECYLE